MKNNKKQQDQPQISASKLLKSQWLFTKLILYLFLGSSGVVLGFILGLHLKNVSFNINVERFLSLNSIPSKHQPPPPSCVPKPLLPSPPPPETRTAKPPVLEPLSKFLTPKMANHSMNDEELLWRASLVPRVNQLPVKLRSKVAFMFLIKRNLPLSPLWENFFKGHEDSYSIYIHTSGQDFIDDTPETSPFYRRRIPSEPVKWGTHSMVAAERRLLANALLDFSNQRFVLLSESDIPLFKFPTIYNYLMNSQKSFVEIYQLNSPVGNGRYSYWMLPEITIQQWRKGAQWFEIDRDMAIEVVSDRTYYPVFEQHCRNACYSDEHYLPTFMHIRFPDRSWNRSLTWTDWSHGGAHPRKFSRQFVTERLLRLMRNNGKTCEYNGNETNICYLFARKFDQNALGRLLRFSPKIMNF